MFKSTEYSSTVAKVTIYLPLVCNPTFGPSAEFPLMLLLTPRHVLKNQERSSNQLKSTLEN